MIIIDWGKLKSTDRRELLSGEKIRKIEGNKYLGTIGYDIVKEQEISSRMRMILKTEWKK